MDSREHLHQSLCFFILLRLLIKKILGSFLVEFKKNEVGFSRVRIEKLFFFSSIKRLGQLVYGL